MYPILYQWGNLRIGSYGLLVAFAFLTAILVINREFRGAGRDVNLAWDIYLLAMIGGMVGSKLLFIAENWQMFLRNPTHLIVSSTGFSVFGGFVLSFILCFIRVRFGRIPFLSTADLVAPGIAAGYIVGRLGCITAGDGCYGRPTLLPWGMTFPRGLCPTLAVKNPDLASRWVSLFPGRAIPTDIPVHPTPLYESLSALFLTLALLSYRPVGRPGRRLALFFTWFGLARFFVEFLRLNPVWALGLTSDQWIAAGFFSLGVAMFLFLPVSSPPPVEIPHPLHDLTDSNYDPPPETLHGSEAPKPAATESQVQQIANDENHRFSRGCDEFSLLP